MEEQVHTARETMDERLSLREAFLFFQQIPWIERGKGWELYKYGKAWEGGKSRMKTGVKEAYEYQRIRKRHTPHKPYLRNSLRAFCFGGAVCLLGQIFQMMYMRVFDFSEREAANPTAATLIFLSVLLTGLGVYDRIGQWAGAGAAVPVTGFANAMASAALEHKSEGYILGVGGNMFKVSGPVIVLGTVAAFLVALVRELFRMI